jgi:hypothetical protein
MANFCTLTVENSGKVISGSVTIETLKQIKINLACVPGGVLRQLTLKPLLGLNLGIRSQCRQLHGGKRNEKLEPYLRKPHGSGLISRGHISNFSLGAVTYFSARHYLIMGN